MKKIILLITFYLPAIFLFAQPGKSRQTTNRKDIVIGRSEEIQSASLGEKRLLNIYLPEGYNENDSANYPVIYLLDGSIDEDFIHVAGLVQFNSFEWVDRVKKSIVVGIATVDRRRDFTFPTTIEKDRKAYPTSGHSKKFIQFIESELQPYIDKTYRTSSIKTLIGQSLGGLLATEILFTKPRLFTHYIIISPSLWWNNGSLLNESSKQIENINSARSIYIGVGKEGLTPTEIPRVMEVDANLLHEKLQLVKNRHLRLFFDYLPAETHATIMHQALLNAFKVIYTQPAGKE